MTAAAVSSGTPLRCGSPCAPATATSASARARRARAPCSRPAAAAYVARSTRPPSTVAAHVRLAATERATTSLSSFALPRRQEEVDDEGDRATDERVDQPLRGGLRDRLALDLEQAGDQRRQGGRPEGEVGPHGEVRRGREHPDEHDQPGPPRVEHGHRAPGHEHPGQRPREPAETALHRRGVVRPQHDDRGHGDPVAPLEPERGGHHVAHGHGEREAYGVPEERRPGSTRGADGPNDVAQALAAPQRWSSGVGLPGRVEQRGRLVQLALDRGQAWCRQALGPGSSPRGRSAARCRRSAARPSGGAESAAAMPAMASPAAERSRAAPASARRPSATSSRRSQSARSRRPRSRWPLVPRAELMASVEAAPDSATSAPTSRPSSALRAEIGEGGPGRREGALLGAVRAQRPAAQRHQRLQGAADEDAERRPARGCRTRPTRTPGSARSSAPPRARRSVRSRPSGRPGTRRRPSPRWPPRACRARRPRSSRPAPGPRWPRPSSPAAPDRAPARRRSPPAAHPWLRRTRAAARRGRSRRPGPARR